MLRDVTSSVDVSQAACNDVVISIKHALTHRQNDQLFQDGFDYQSIDIRNISLRD